MTQQFKKKLALQGESGVEDRDLKIYESSDEFFLSKISQPLNDQDRQAFKRLYAHSNKIKNRKPIDP